jgi:hypothetical protein
MLKSTQINLKNTEYILDLIVMCYIFDVCSFAFVFRVDDMLKFRNLLSMYSSKIFTHLNPITQYHSSIQFLQPGRHKNPFTTLLNLSL